MARIGQVGKDVVPAADAADGRIAGPVVQVAGVRSNIRSFDAYVER